MYQIIYKNLVWATVEDLRRATRLVTLCSRRGFRYELFEVVEVDGQQNKARGIYYE